MGVGVGAVGVGVGIGEPEIRRGLFEWATTNALKPRIGRQRKALVHAPVALCRDASPRVDHVRGA
jgi:hypothetical protein